MSTNRKLEFENADKLKCLQQSFLHVSKNEKLFVYKKLSVYLLNSLVLKCLQQSFLFANFYKDFVQKCLQISFFKRQSKYFVEIVDKFAVM